MKSLKLHFLESVEQIARTKWNFPDFLELRVVSSLRMLGQRIFLNLK